MRQREKKKDCGRRVSASGGQHSGTPRDISGSGPRDSLMIEIKHRLMLGSASTKLQN